MTDNACVDYRLLNEQLAAIVADESDALANSANFVGLLYNAISNVNWLGIYVLRGNDLVLGPFQGKPACIRIPLGRGVCGSAAAKRETLRIDDVHNFEGHIACDTTSRSELVVPLIVGGELLGVLDVDSRLIGRFGDADQAGIEYLCAAFVEILERRGLRLPEFI